MGVGPAITRLEVNTGHSRMSAMMFGEYFPNPGISTLKDDDIPALHAAFIEAAGTCILVFFICSLTDKRNKSRPNDEMVPFFIGFTLAVLISILAPLTQAGFNPARDFAPRMVCWIAGWGPVAFPGPRGGFWVYIVGPFLGGPAGMLIHDQIAARLWYFEDESTSKILNVDADEEIELGS
jgi:glycerol uptake facilitator protein